MYVTHRSSSCRFVTGLKRFAMVYWMDWCLLHRHQQIWLKNMEVFLQYACRFKSSQKLTRKQTLILPYISIWVQNKAFSIKLKIFTCKQGLTKCIDSSLSVMNKRNSVLHSLLTRIRSVEEGCTQGSCSGL